MIRQATPEDASAVLSIYAPFCRTTATTFECVPPEESDIALRIEHFNRTHLFLVDQEGSEIRGYAYAGPHRDRAAYRWSCDVSVYIRLGDENKGLGTKLYACLLDTLRNRGFYNAYAGITLPNVASVRLHEKMGFHHIGTYERVGYKLGTWRDVGWWHLVLKEHDDRPCEPTWPSS